MKRIISLTCALLMIVLAGCSKNNADTTTTASAAEETTFNEAVSKVGEFTTSASASEVISRYQKKYDTKYNYGELSGGTFANELNVPAINIDTDAAMALNDKIVADIGTDVIDFFKLIEDNGKVIDVNKHGAAIYSVTHKWRVNNGMILIEVSKNTGSMNSNFTLYAYTYYYDVKADKELTFDEFLAKLDVTKQQLFDGFTKTETAKGFASGDGIYTDSMMNIAYSVDSVTGLFPATDDQWDLKLQGKQGTEQMEYCIVIPIAAVK